MSKKLLYLTAWLSLFGTAIACTSLANPAGVVQVRIANQSTQDFERVTVAFPSGKVDYGTVKKGETTPYRHVEKAYRYAQIEAVVNGKTLTLQPQDYLGESPLDSGRYTYALRLDESGDNLQFEMIVD